eukprot:6656485-Pyramimonas_sp.AAC.1
MWVRCPFDPVWARVGISRLFQDFLSNPLAQDTCKRFFGKVPAIRPAWVASSPPFGQVAQRAAS